MRDTDRGKDIKTEIEREGRQGGRNNLNSCAVATKIPRCNETMLSIFFPCEIRDEGHKSSLPK